MVWLCENYWNYSSLSKSTWRMQSGGSVPLLQHYGVTTKQNPPTEMGQYSEMNKFDSFACEYV